MTISQVAKREPVTLRADLVRQLEVLSAHAMAIEEGADGPKSVEDFVDRAVQSFLTGCKRFTETNS